ncbi:type II toxin-antitoxin system HipA family toxin [Henriciella sp. AS95]|uniref:type II toxin-antitoxin system HipA family toxin n=1 Tax=Henriciella sp. AS95 TaxID=3135782 RepID=UPI00316C1F3F
MAIFNEVTIYYEAFSVGHVQVQDDSKLSFVYDKRWLATKGSFPLSVTMPLAEAMYPDQVITPWLANLLPEEQQLLTLSRALGLSSTDALAILKEIGGDTAGAISIGEPSDKANWSYRPITDHYGTEDPQDALTGHFKDLGQRPFLAGEDGVRLSLAGGQKKTALAVLDAAGAPKLGLPERGDQLAIPMSGAPSTLIIKPDNPNLPGIVENEAYCLTLAKLIGMAVADVSIMDVGNRTALAVARYDRTTRKDGSLRRLHQEDFAQANGIFPSQKYEQGTVVGLDLNRLLTTAQHLPAQDALTLQDQVIFNILVANTDAHAKNYSMLLSGGQTMAPLYDVSTVLHWDHVNQYHAQKLGGRKRKPADMARRHWERIADAAGFSPRGIRLRVQELVDVMVAKRIEAVEAVCAQSGAERGMVEHVAGLIERNALRIAGRLKE